MEARPFERHQPKALYLYGPTGIGKTHNTMSAITHSQKSFYIHQVGLQKWYGYQEQEIIFLDYLGGFQFNKMYSIISDTPYKVRSQHGLIQLRSKYIIIIGFVPPEDLYPSAKRRNRHAWNSLQRRISESVNVSDMNHQEIEDIVTSFLKN